jgi:nitrogen fixation protein NifB
MSRFARKDKIRVAISTTGSSGVVDLHFGHAKRFSIYEAEVKTRSVRFLEERVVREAYCQGPECDLPEGQEALMQHLIDLLKDCNFLLTRRIGPAPEAMLMKAGIISIMSADTIESAIQKILR